MRQAVAAIARLTWKRMRRGRTLWVTGLLLLVPLAVAALALARVADPADRWSLVAELTLRSLVLLAPVLHLAPAVGEEREGKTYTYLWSRPVPRPALILGKLAAVAPVALVAALAALSLAYLLVALGPGGGDPAWLPRALLAAAVGVVSASCFALGIGALFTRHPLVAALAYVFFAEQILPQVKAVQNLATLFHVKVIAALPRGVPLGAGGDTGSALLALAILSALWLGLAIWRVQRVELGTAEG